MKRLFSVIVLVAVLTVPFGMNAQTVEKDWEAILSGPIYDGGNDHMVWYEKDFFASSVSTQLQPVSSEPPLVDFEFIGWSGDSDEFLVHTTADHKPEGKEGDFGLFPFLGKSFYKFVLKPAYIATKASGLTGGKAVKFFFKKVGHFLF